MALAEERRQRGNTLVGGAHFLMADAEYEQALRYLIFMPHPEPEQALSDGATMVPLDRMRPLLEMAMAVHSVNGGRQG